MDLSCQLLFSLGHIFDNFTIAALFSLLLVLQLEYHLENNSYIFNIPITILLVVLLVLVLMV